MFPTPSTEAICSLLPHYTVEIVSLENIRLSEGRARRGDYLSLSHRWGVVGKPPLRTTTANLQAHKREIPWTSLSKTFQDAVKLTELLGYTHLWIDSLCIVQDDVDDWSREAKQMYNVYGNATLSIIATSPEGLFFERKVSDFFRSRAGRQPLQRTYRLPGRDGSLYDIHAVPKGAHHDNTNINDLVPHGNLFTRGWVLQERLMCRRAIVFGEHELLWSCDHRNICECSGSVVTRFRDVHLLNRSEYRESLRRGEQSPSLWRRVVQEYASKALTFESDRLPALSGLVKQYRPDFATQYVAGCWKDGIVETLVWCGGSKPLSQNDSTPSWSWAGACPNVKFPGVDMRIFEDVVQLDKVTSTLATSDPTGQVKDGSLSLTGPCVSA